VQNVLRIASAGLNSTADGVVGGVNVWERDVGFALAASMSSERGDSDSAYRVLGEGDRSWVRVGDMIVADSSINS
jgi:hypothetical protein